MNNSINARFSASATTYNQHSLLQENIAYEVAKLTSTIDKPNTLLEIGCGTGFLTVELLKKYPKAQHTVIDISSQMIEVAKNKIGNSSNIEWLNQDLIKLSLDKQFDLQVSSSSLHWIQPISLAFSRIANHSTPEGYFIFGMMTNGTFKELNRARRNLVPQKKTGVNLPSDTDVITALEINGYKILTKNIKQYKTNHKSAEVFIKSIHEQGVTGQTNSSTVLTRKELRDLMDYYNTYFREQDGTVNATYEVLYIIAQTGK